MDYAGFAVVALDCLLIDTIQSFVEGESSSGTEFFERFINEGYLNGDLGSRCDDFVRNVRNPVLHDGETRGNWLIRSDPSAGWIVRDDADGVVLNRDALHGAIVRDFDAYLARLRDPQPIHDGLRDKFLRRLTALCKGEKANKDKGAAP